MIPEALQVLPLHAIADPMIGAEPSGACFEHLLRSHENDLRAFISAIVCDQSVRDDIYQDTARALWESFSQYDGVRPFGAWARGVARNVMRQHRKRAAREARWFSPAAEEAISAAWEESPADHHAARLAALTECLAALPGDGREVITLFYTARQRVAAIARRMSRTTESVYQLLTRTRARLSACVKRRLEQTDSEFPSV